MKGAQFSYSMQGGPAMRVQASAAIHLLVAFALFACQPVVEQAEVDASAAEEAALRKADAEWLKAFAAKDVEGMVSYYAEEASVFPPNAPIVSGQEAIRGMWEELTANPGFEVTWESVKVEMARSGDLAWVQETYVFRMQDAEGELQEDRGKAVVVWKKQPDGSWKAVADIFNSDLPLGDAAE